MAQNGIATTEKTTFHRTTSIVQIIEASPSILWSLLIQLDKYATWNSTILSIEGTIKEGNKIKLKSTLAPERTFKLKVKEVLTDQKLVWGDAMGNRTYTLQKQGNKTLFSMSEKIGGLLFPLFASKIPSFDASFEQFTKDLKTAAEATPNSK